MTKELTLDEIAKHELELDFETFLGRVSDEDLLNCVHDDHVMIPGMWMGKSVAHFDDVLNGGALAKQEAIEAELNRRGLEWRQYSDEERDCLWSLQHLMFSSTVTPKDIEEFHRLVKANGGKVPYLKFTGGEETAKRLEAVGLVADWTHDDKYGWWWDEIKGLKQ